MSEPPGLADAPGSGERAPTQSLVAGTVGDRCVSCGRPMTSDQRYCVACGERRGQARFTLPPSASATADPAVASGQARPPRESRSSSSTTVIAGVGTLLLAMGVGVLIGRDSANNVRPIQAAAPVVTVVGGVGTGTSAAPSGGSTTKKTFKSHTKSKSKPKSKDKAASKPSAAQAKKASQAASKVLGSGNLPPATVTQGQTGSGPGFNKQTHKFDGSFFGQ